jgi:hypothetical protein
MRCRRLLLAAPVGVLLLAGCGGSKPATNAASNPVTASQATAPSASASSTPTTTSTPTTGAKQPAKHKATTSAGATTHSTATVGATTHSTASTTRSASAATKTTTAAAAKPKSPVACMVRVGLQHVGPAFQAGTWQGTDDVSHRPIFVDGPYKSAAAAKQSVDTLLSVNQAAAGGVWEVSASLRGGTGPAVRRVAACLGGI